MPHSHPSPIPDDSADDATPLLAPTSLPISAARTRVREAVVEQIEERQSDWAYSRPIVLLDLFWNSILLISSLVVLVISRLETTSVPIRLWIVGHGIQCLLHMVCVCFEYRKRQALRLAFRHRGNTALAHNSSAALLPGNLDDAGFVDAVPPAQTEVEDSTSVAKHLESANTMFTFIWWIIGFYWVSSGGSTLAEDAPDLYWFCIVLLALDVFFVVLCVVVACLIGIAVCFCLPCIIAILYAVADKKGATKEEIEELPRFIFRSTGESEKQNDETEESSGGIMFECGVDSHEAMGRSLSPDNVTCVICFYEYKDKEELRQLPCLHHFHSECIGKWLHINAICPLCMRCVLKNAEQQA